MSPQSNGICGILFPNKAQQNGLNKERDNWKPEAMQTSDTNRYMYLMGRKMPFQSTIKRQEQLKGY